MPSLQAWSWTVVSPVNINIFEWQMLLTAATKRTVPRLMLSSIGLGVMLLHGDGSGSEAVELAKQWPYGSIAVLRQAMHGSLHFAKINESMLHKSRALSM